MSSIHLGIDKIKQEGRGMLEIGLKDWGMAILVTLVALVAFGLGRLSALEDAQPLIAIQEAPGGFEDRALPLGGQYVASRTGSVYYFPWCGGAEQIPVQQQVWFNSENAARTAGYHAAKNCKGLAQ